MRRGDWTGDHDYELLRLTGKLPDREIAVRLTAMRGVPTSVDSVQQRRQRIKAAVVDTPPPAARRPEREESSGRGRVPSDDPPDTLRSAPGAEMPRVAIPPPPIEQAGTDARMDESLRQLLRLTRSRATTFEQACDALDMSPMKLRALVDDARLRGVRVEIDGDHVGRRPSAESDSEQPVEGVAQSGDMRIIALVGDIHIGSKHHMRAQLADFCRIAHERGVRTFCHVGDLLDGVYKHSVWEQSHRGFEEQCGEAIRSLPQLPGSTWHFVEGNHDETLGESNGLAVGPAIVQAFRAAGRHDIVYHGARGAYLRLRGANDARGLLLHMWHPRDKGNAYARSYVHQKKIEGFPVGGKPDILAVGHHHTQSYITTRGVHAFGCGCWQGSGSSFAKSLRGAPDIGSWIVEYSLTEGGTVRRIRPEWLAYYERENVRDVELG